MWPIFVSGCVCVRSLSVLWLYWEVVVGWEGSCGDPEDVVQDVLDGGNFCVIIILL